MPLKKKSIKVNMVLNAIKGITSIIFPLITFPYVSKILGVDNIGKYNFCASVINYFILFAGLGISTYAIREGAKVREDTQNFIQLSNELFTINTLSTFLSYVLLIITIIAVPKFHENTVLLIVLSLQIGFKTIGIDWIYSIFEDYTYITVRSILFQFLSLVLMFALVRSADDVVVYAVITVISSVGSNILNFFHARKYCSVKITKQINWKRHLKPILILFATSVTVTIYVSSDTTILGFICDDYTVGIYSVSVKVYSIIKTILSSILVVSIPRLSSLLGQNRRNEFNLVASDIYSTLISLVLPSVTGIIMLRRQIVLLISDFSYIEATSSLVLLSIALLFCMGAYYWGQCILVPLKMENTVFSITVISAAVNIGLNLILIPIWKENAAAVTTIIAEGISYAWCCYKGRHIIKPVKVISTALKSSIGCIGIVIVAIIGNMFITNGYIYTSVTIAGSVFIYGLVEFVLENEAIMSMIKGIKSKIGKR